MLNAPQVVISRTLGKDSWRFSIFEREINYGVFVIISFRHKFVFIKTLKTAGSSIEASLNPYLGPEDIATPIFPSIEGHRPQNHVFDGVRVRNHGSAREARELITRHGDKPDNFHFWSVEREPLDKCLSHFSMMRYSPDHGRFRLSNPRSLLLQPPVFNWNTYCLRGSFPLDDERLLDEDGILQVDTLLRYERLSTDLGDFVRSLGVNGFSLDATVKSGFRGGKRQRIRGWQVRRIYQAFDRSLPHTGYDSESVARTLEKLAQRPLS